MLVKLSPCLLKSQIQFDLTTVYTHTMRCSECKLLATSSCVRSLGQEAPPSCSGRCPSDDACQTVRNLSFPESEKMISRFS